MGDFSGIDPTALTGMIKSFSSDKDHLRGRASSYKTEFANHGLDTGPLNELVGICGWLDDQLPGLKRRQGLAVAMDHPAGTNHMVQVPEPIITSAQAQADGKALADRFNKNTSGDGKAGAAYHEMAQELAAHKDDPDFCSAFYANLDPVLVTTLPANLAATGSSTAADDLKIYSHAFGTAVSATSPAPGFDKVKQAYLKPLPDEGYTVPAWNRAAMMAYGDFPSDFLAKATRANGLDMFAKHPDHDFEGEASEARALGLPQDLVALNLGDLSHNSRAAFFAVAQMGDPKNPDLQGHLKLLMKYGEHREDVQTNLGDMIDTASGVRGSYDKNGVWHIDPSYKPDDYEQNFALLAITAAGHDKGLLDFNGNFKNDMGRLAATYAPEMLTGGHNVDEDPNSPSGFGQPVPYDPIPGVDPRFYLSPGDTYLFMKTFADDDGKTGPFDTAMGKLQQDVLAAAARSDRQAIADGKQDPRSFEFAAKAFGNTQRLEYKAEMKIRGEMDESEKAFKEDLKMAAVGVSELVGEPELPAAGALAWRGGMFAIKEFGGGAYVDSGPDRTEAVEEAHTEAVAQSNYTTTSALLAGGWKTDPLPADLRGEDGKLKPYEDLVKDHKLDEFNNWVNDQRSGPVPFHTKAVLSGGELSNEQADQYADAADSGE